MAPCRITLLRTACLGVPKANFYRNKYRRFKMPCQAFCWRCRGKVEMSPCWQSRNVACCLKRPEHNRPFPQSENRHLWRGHFCRHSVLFAFVRVDQQTPLHWELEMTKAIIAYLLCGSAILSAGADSVLERRKQ